MCGYQEQVGTLQNEIEDLRQADADNIYSMEVMEQELAELRSKQHQPASPGARERLRVQGLGFLCMVKHRALLEFVVVRVADVSERIPRSGCVAMCPQPKK